MELGPPLPQSKSRTATPPLVPTPPAEVFIRTMESDVRSLRESGGARPKAERIVLSPNAPESERPRLAWLTSQKIEMRWLLLAGGTAVVLGGILVYAFLQSLPRLTTPTPVPLEEVTAPGQEVLTNTTSSSEMPLSRRGGIFRKALDASFSFVAVGTAENLNELKTPVQRLEEILASLSSSTSTLLHMVPVEPSGNPVSLLETFSLLDLLLLDPSFLSRYFEERFGMFVYREGREWQPGYVLALRPGENWLFLKEEISALEESPKLANFYLRSPGAPKGGFRDVQVGDVTARALEWSLPAGQAGSGAKFIYGWFRGYLILSTSQAGLEAVLPKL